MAKIKNVLKSAISSRLKKVWVFVETLTWDVPLNNWEKCFSNVMYLFNSEYSSGSGFSGYCVLCLTQTQTIRCWEGPQLYVLSLLVSGHLLMLDPFVGLLVLSPEFHDPAPTRSGEGWQSSDCPMPTNQFSDQMIKSGPPQKWSFILCILRQ